jgi:hypothetical protein
MARAAWSSFILLSTSAAISCACMARADVFHRRIDGQGAKYSEA